MTPLIDVIFLLLLFFMLSSTFSKFGEIELTHAAAGAGTQAEKPWFLQLSEDGLRLNGADTPLEAVAETVDTGIILVSLAAGTSSQRLVDLLAQLRGKPGLSVTVLE
ncbi:biopolymer transporter ExbD [Algicella marina]|uniref:Biopolymer transporter ExbD n=2 Tax=Algicella marina TaxID=2683284 RepID=A0A6P1T3L1_9RHOB|nr:biopolymer transporter ExbD [Algicella marina]